MALSSLICLSSIAGQVFMGAVESGVAAVSLDSAVKMNPHYVPKGQL